MASSSRLERITDVARQLFTSRGYDGTAVGDIAKELGISKAAITYYFPLKADFLTALLDPLLVELQEVIETSRSTDMAWPVGARTLLLAYLDVLIDNDDLALWADSDPALKLNDGPGATLRRLDRQLADLIAGADSSDGDRLRALSVIGGIWRPLHHEAPSRIRRHADEIIDAALVSYAPITE